MTSVEEIAWRRLLFFGHGCRTSALYGDDGEMQCSACSVDFRRMSVFEIEEQWRLNAALALASNASAPKAPPSPSEAARLQENQERAAPPREPRSARFTVLADQEDDHPEQDYILLDIPPTQARQVYEKVKAALECANDDPNPNVLIGVYVEVEPHRQSFWAKGHPTTYPPSLLRDDIDPPPAGPSQAVESLTPALPEEK